jgi:hypothetical protein
MNSSTIFFLKTARKLCSWFYVKSDLKPASIKDPDIASNKIYELLDSDQPVMIARFGSTELTCIANYLSIKSSKKFLLAYIQGRQPPWWWNQTIIEQMQINAGFFPASEDALERFCDLMLHDVAEVDLLGSWLVDEHVFDAELKNIPKVHLELLNPYFSSNPWTKALEGKKILIVHPFARTIEAQYAKRKLLFKNNLLPEFELKTIKAVQSIAGEQTQFKDWFEALGSMKKAMDLVDYDICLIGCGAYGFPLAAHAKRMGKKGFHLGGSLQLLFGIRGKRWEDTNYNADYNYAALMNEHWIRPIQEDRPIAAHKVEGACYW